MTTLTAADSGPYVFLSLTPSQAVTALTRSDSNGHHPVRLPGGIFPRTTAMTWWDYEASLEGRLVYMAETAAGTITARLERSSTAPWIVFPAAPGLGLELEAVTAYSAGRATLSTVSQVPGRPDPLVALGGLATRTGRLDIYCPTMGAARERETALERNPLAMLKTPDQAGMDMYFLTMDTTISPEDGAWILSVSYQETARPADAWPVWNMQALGASAATFTALEARFPSFRSMALNDTTGSL